MTIKKWEKIKTKRAFDNFAKIDITTFKMSNGKLKDFDIKTTDHDVVSIFGITADKKVILVKQFRPGPEKIFYEFPLGFIEKNEKPIEAAKREFLEETGYSGNFKDTGVIEYISSYNKVGIYCFIAINCHKITNDLILDEGELIEVYLLPLPNIRKMLKTGQIRNFGEGYLALDHLGLL